MSYHRLTPTFLNEVIKYNLASDQQKKADYRSYMVSSPPINNPPSLYRIFTSGIGFAFFCMSSLITAPTALIVNFFSIQASDKKKQNNLTIITRPPGIGAVAEVINNFYPKFFKIAVFGTSGFEPLSYSIRIDSSEPSIKTPNPTFSYPTAERVDDKNAALEGKSLVNI